MTRKLLAIPLTLLLVLPACGPKQDGVEVPTINRVAVAAKDFSDSVETFQLAEIELYNQGIISQGAHIEIQKALIETSLAGRELNNAILIAKSEPGTAIAVDKALEATARLLQNTRRIKNQNTRVQLTSAVMTARAFLAIIFALYGGDNDSTDTSYLGIPFAPRYQPLQIAA